MSNSGADRDAKAEISVLAVANAVLRRRRVVVGAALSVFTIVTVFTLVMPRTYTAMASFVPQTDASGLSRLASLGAQFGLSIPTGAGAQSPELYAALVR